MNSYTKFEIGFHIFVLLAAIAIVLSYAMNDFQIFYMVLGAVIGVSSLIRLVRLLKNPQAER
ncbi:hypothetical protein [Lentibacillus sp.]|uniref:hypothetical protein n=1 Tax=Lentibacillus sp. TaxID=1925746 RepID=UPI002B4AF035|nr:hypothetical protein [Lentibacillus sp.]HLS07730.1 hypothetical protein [Lentibacillus sp.]